MGFFDWLGRVVMLVLAGMITLSIIGAIAAIPSGGLPERFGMAGPQTTAPSPPEPAPSAQPPMSTARPADEPDGTGTGQAGVAPDPETVDPARWLEAITYALLALVGIAALATLILWRMLHQRRRIADAVETIAARATPGGSSG